MKRFIDVRFSMKGFSPHHHLPCGTGGTGGIGGNLSPVLSHLSCKGTVDCPLYLSIMMFFRKKRDFLLLRKKTSSAYITFAPES